jgi:fatty-acyl-CoA synthase
MLGTIRRQLPTQLRMIRFGISMLRRHSGSTYTVADLIERQARRRGDHCFVRFEGREITYREYNAAANRVANWAVAQHIAQGERVALLMQNRPEFLELWAGFAKVGVTTALINTNLTGRALAHVLETAKAHRLIVGSECAENLGTLGTGVLRGLDVWVAADPGHRQAKPSLIGAGNLEREVAKCLPTNPPRHLRASLRAGDDLFYIYTSGTTGLPKAARFSHMRFLGASIHSALQGFGKNDTMYSTLPLYHTAGGVLAVSAVLQGGGTLALRRRFSASRFWDDVVEMDATAFIYIGELCRYLLRQPPHPRERRHRIRFVVGNGLRPDIWEAFRDRFQIPHIVEFYGATEANVTMMNLDDRVGSVGKLLPGLKSDARLIRYDVSRDEHERDNEGRCIPCAPGEVGELIGRISEGRTARGRYEGYTSKEASEQKILRDVFAKGDAWFRTGDLLRTDERGYFYFMDRIGDTFRWKGENVSTQEVAEVVGAYDGVELCTVYGVQVPGADGRAGMAALAIRNGDQLDGEEFYAFAAAALPAYAMPVFVRLRHELDTTGTFKLLKTDLQRDGFDPAKVTDPLYIRDDRRRAYVPLTPAIHDDVVAGGLQ